MAKIILITEHIKNEISFIKNIRSIYGESIIPKSITEIKKAIKDKTPIFEGIVMGGENENLECVKKILHFTNREGDAIKIFLVTSAKNFPNINKNDEITQDGFNNWIESVEDTRRHLEEMDELSEE